ncbi:MAG: hypothetical protein HY043_09895 [Verrucomicrobia bacterium]|nr:hypothetical protein [Verrucomicrobiota bacterium]
MKRNTLAGFSNFLIAVALLAGALPVTVANSAELPPLPPIPAPTTNVLEFATAHFLVSETNSTVTVTVLRRGDTNSTASGRCWERCPNQPSRFSTPSRR